MNSAVILSLIISVAAETGIDPYLARALVLQENPALVPDLAAGPNADGTYDLGLAGLNSAYIGYFMEKYWDNEWAFDWREPYDNLYVGLRHLRYLIRAARANAWLALIFYNAGQRWYMDGGVPPPESIEYANRVFRRWNGYRGYKW
jgi:hypothetical protein